MHTSCYCVLDLLLVNMNHTAITRRVLQNGKKVNQNYFDSSSIKKVWGQLNLSLLYCFLRSSKKKFIFTVNTKCSLIWFCSYPLKGNQGPWTSESKYSCSLCVFCHFYCRKLWKWYMAKRSIFELIPQGWSTQKPWSKHPTKLLKAHFPMCAYPYNLYYFTAIKHSPIA